MPTASLTDPIPAMAHDVAAISYFDPAMSALQQRVVRMVERLTGQRWLKSIYEGYHADGGDPARFWPEMMRRAGIRLRYDEAALRAIPAEGPVVVVANHPYGLVDGFGLCWLIHQVRPDFRLLINAVLVQAPETKQVMLPIDFSGTDEARAINLRTREAARRYLAAGGAVLVFPAGGISTAPDRLGRRPAMDAPWGAFAGQMMHRSRCPVVPIYFQGQNSRLFQMASHVSNTLRLALIAGEVQRRHGAEVGVTIGAPIPYSELAPIRSHAILARELCRRTYALGAIDTTRPGVIVDIPKAMQPKPKKKPRIAA